MPYTSFSYQQKSLVDGWIFVQITKDQIDSNHQQPNCIISNTMRKVCYVTNPQFTSFQLSKNHLMKPKRVQLAQSLIHSYHLLPLLRTFQGKQAENHQLLSFHDADYIQYLSTWVSPMPENILKQNANQQVIRRYPAQQQLQNIYQMDRRLWQRYQINTSEDCPGFKDMLKFCQLAAGASIDAAHLIIAEQSQIVLNWMGGYHHAKHSQASGFCYVNDIVICILQLLKCYPRVLYLDIDVHHGDAVQQAFYHTNRVMTVSFHQYTPSFFPQTGSINQNGQGIGQGYSINVPLKQGIGDLKYCWLFRQVMGRVMQSYRPDVVVVQCGADSLSKDRLGNLNLSIKGHAECLNFMKGFGVKMICLGGGGYTIQNVARCWTYETGLMSGVEIDDDIPNNNEHHYYYIKDNYKLHFAIQHMIDLNSKAQLDNIVREVSEKLRETEGRPAVGYHLSPSLVYRQSMEMEINQ